jgi:proline iminopeptidase
MKKMILKGMLISVLVAILYLLFLIFMPQSYDIPLAVKRESTQYWDLPTASRIGYTHLIAKGDKHPYPVIYLHGGPGGPIYDSNIKLLSALTDDGYDVYLYDQVGCGWSSRLADIAEYTAARHKADLSAIINTIGADKVILIGQSWGAVLATLFITDHPDKVEKAIFTGPGPILPIHSGVERIKAPDALGLKAPVFTNKQGREKIYTLRATVVEKLAKAFNWKLAADNEMDQFVTVLNHEMSKSTVCDTNVTSPIESGSGYYSMIKTVQSFKDLPDTRTKLMDCSTPLLIMRGQCDGIKWGYIVEYYTYFKNRKVVIVPDAGHAIAREQPELYIKHILEFLKG